MLAWSSPNDLQLERIYQKRYQAADTRCAVDQADRLDWDQLEPQDLGFELRLEKKKTKNNVIVDTFPNSLILLRKDFYDIFLRFLLSFSFGWEDISNTKDDVWPHFRSPQSSSKIRIFNSLLGDWKEKEIGRDFSSFLPLRKTKPWSQVTHWPTIEAENHSQTLCVAKTAI